MKPLSLCLLATSVLLVLLGALSPNRAAPGVQPPDQAALQEINGLMDKLGKKVASLRRQGVVDPWLAEVEVYHKAVTWIVRLQEFNQPESGAWTVEALHRGLLRASQAERGEAPWFFQTGNAVARAYRSRIDGSVQPYAVTLPADYGKDPQKKWRLDVVLHGRDDKLNEIKFLHEHNGEEPSSRERDYVQLDIYGRGNNAYRWAGESDVWEALDAFAAVERRLGRINLLDPTRVVLRGFSMGGAGTWQLGLHTPSRWCLLGPGAGFTVTHGFVKDLPEKLPAYQEACLHIYDAADYAENVFDVPVVAYAGSKDPQLQAARTIEERLKPAHIPFKLLVAPGLGHTFPPEWQKKAEEEYARHSGEETGRKEYPDQVHFVTYTLRYSSCAWVEIGALDRHYERALVDAERTESGFTVKTDNVHSLRLAVPSSAPQALVVEIDGQTVKTRPYLSQSGALNVYLEKRAGHWSSVLPQKLLTDRLRHRRKISGLQGPLDDAFMDSFLCVRGTGSAWHEATQRYAEANLQRFRQEWSKYLRGDVPVKDDVDVSDEDIATRHLILFGDPASNALIAQVLDGLPLQWTQEKIRMAGQDYAAAEHVPLLIYPSPLNTERYVVLNSGHTFHAADFQGTNALLYPRLGDYAVLKLAGTDKEPLAADVVHAGLFDESWQFGKNHE